MLIRNCSSSSSPHSQIAQTPQGKRLNFSNQIPSISPLAFTSTLAARETFGNPGISIMLPAIATTKPAPAEREASVILSVHPVGAPRSLGLSENEYCVLAMHTGSEPNPQSLNCCSLARALSLKATPAAP